MTSPDWVAVGAEVAEYYSSTFGIPTVKLTTIDRLTDTQVVCTNGSRYSRARTTVGGGLQAVGSSNYDLRPASDRDVLRAQSRRHLADLFNAVDRIERSTQRGYVDVPAVLAEVEQAVATARANIESLGG